MTAKQLFSKTTPFIIAKLMLGGATVLISALLLAIMMGLGWLFGEGGMLIMFMKTTIQLRPKAVPNNLLRPDNEARYIIIDENSGAILDNNNGYGYKTVI